MNVELPDELVLALARQIAPHVAELVRGPAGPEPWVEVEAAARHLGYEDDLSRGRRRIYDLAGRRDSSRIPHRRDGRRLLFRLSDLDRWLEQGGAG